MNLEILLCTVNTISTTIGTRFFEQEIVRRTVAHGTRQDASFVGGKNKK